MTFAGWVIMLLSVSAVTGLFVWCIWKVLSTPGETERIQGHGFDTETPDRESDKS